jgi:hypothetical protein
MAAMKPRLIVDVAPSNSSIRREVTPVEQAEELRLWADYYEATARIMEIMRAEGTSAATLPRIASEEARAAAAIKRIKEIRGLDEIG